MWKVPYTPGTLKIVAYQNGKPISEKSRITAGPPSGISLIPDRDQIHADGEDLSFITVRIEDDEGNLCPTVENLVRFTVTGEGEIAAVGNGNAASVEPFQAEQRKAFNGLCMLIIRSKNDQKGEISIRAESENFQASETIIVVK
jgi:beta-galactosidase